MLGHRKARQSWDRYSGKAVKGKGGLRHPRKVEPQQLSSPGEGESSRAGTANGVLRNALFGNIITGLPSVTSPSPYTLLTRVDTTPSEVRCSEELISKCLAAAKCGALISFSPAQVLPRCLGRH